VRARLGGPTAKTAAPAMALYRTNQRGRQVALSSATICSRAEKSLECEAQRESTRYQDTLDHPESTPNGQDVDGTKRHRWSDYEDPPRCEQRVSDASTCVAWRRAPVKCHQERSYLLDRLLSVWHS